MQSSSPLGPYVGKSCAHAEEALGAVGLDASADESGALALAREPVPAPVSLRRVRPRRVRHRKLDRRRLEDDRDVRVAEAVASGVRERLSQDAVGGWSRTSGRERESPRTSTLTSSPAAR